MIGSCDICDRQNVPVSYFGAGETSAQCETTACFICQGETDPDPFGEQPFVDTKTAIENGDSR